VGSVLSLPFLTTPRLRLDPVTPALLPVLVELNADPEVMRYLLGRAATPEETAAEWRTRLGAHTSTSRGLGYWAGYVDGGFVGWWSASHYADDLSMVGIGYRLRVPAWGRGLATEGATAMVDRAFSRPEVDRVIAQTMAVNLGSRRVMEKTGLRYARTWHGQVDDPIPGTEHGEVEYVVTREQWLARG
jgi:RimJ/RimL family protein N-acetyltransferase